jgi:hypothetical protein
MWWTGPITLYITVTVVVKKISSMHISVEEVMPLIQTNLMEEPRIIK